MTGSDLTEFKAFSNDKLIIHQVIVFLSTKE